jgi:AhpD family alkylhydroperoxidase
MASIGRKLRALIELRVSQINGCAYCVDLHTTEARANGETQQRLDCLPVWRECSFFAESERAALAWAEAVTHVSSTGAPDDLYDALKAHFSDQQIVDLTIIIAQMNAWNRIAVGFRHLPEHRE